MGLIIIVNSLLMSLNPWSNIDWGASQDSAKTNALVASTNRVFIVLAWAGAAISLLVAAMLIANKNKKKRTDGKDRLVHTFIIILCISGAVTIVSTIMAVVESI